MFEFNRFSYFLVSFITIQVYFSCSSFFASWTSMYVRNRSEWIDIIYFMYSNDRDGRCRRVISPSEESIIRLDSGGVDISSSPLLSAVRFVIARRRYWLDQALRLAVCFIWSESYGFSQFLVDWNFFDYFSMPLFHRRINPYLVMKI